MKLCTFPFNGEKHPLYYNTRDELISIVVAEVFEEECYKKGLDWIRKIENPVVLDIGAYVGDTALYFSQHKGATIYAFEPCSGNFECLVENTKDLKNVKICNMGILSGQGKLRLDLGHNEGSGGESVYNKVNRSEEVVMTDIESFMEGMKIDHIDLMKIDVEGAEYEIFANQQFERVNKKIDAIIGETHLEPTLPVIAKKMLEDYGYKFEWLPYENLTYGWSVALRDFKKEVKVKMPTLFWAHR